MKGSKPVFDTYWKAGPKEGAELVRAKACNTAETGQREWPGIAGKAINMSRSWYWLVFECFKVAVKPQVCRVKFDLDRLAAGLKDLALFGSRLAFLSKPKKATKQAAQKLASFGVCTFNVFLIPRRMSGVIGSFFVTLLPFSRLMPLSRDLASQLSVTWYE